MQARRRIQDEAARRQLDAVRAIGVLDQQLAALVLLGRAEKQRRREIGADPVARPADLPDGVVDVAPERVAFFVSIEERWKHLERQRGGEKQRMSLQGGQDGIADIFGNRVVLRELGVELDARGLIAGCDATVDPVGGRQRRARGRDLFGGQDVGDVQEHRMIRACRPVFMRLSLNFKGGKA